MAEKQDRDTDAIVSALAAPFEAGEIKWKPQTVSGNRALAIPFVDARVVMDRLDEVLGILNWQDSYEVLPDGAVVCRLKIRVDTEWITKEDVGGQSEQPDEGDRRKAAFSDALKRCAVKLGVGRYLYRQKPQWVDYDPQKRQFLRTPMLPGSAQQAKPAERLPEAQPARPAHAAAPQPAPAAAPAEPAGKGTPAVGEWARGKEAQLVAQGLCKAGDLEAHLTAKLGRGYSGAVGLHSPSVLAEVRFWTDFFEKERRDQKRLDWMESELTRTGRDWEAVRRWLRTAEEKDGAEKPITLTAAPSDMTEPQWERVLKRLARTEDAAKTAAVGS